MFGGILLPNVPPNSPLPPLWDPHYEPLWELCEELDVLCNVHAGSGLPDFGSQPAARAIMLIELAWYAHRAVWHLIFGGVLERHPEPAGRAHRAGHELDPARHRHARLVPPPHDARRRGRGRVLRRGHQGHVADAERVLPAQLLGRRELPPAVGERAALRGRHRPHHVGRRLSALRGQLPVHDRSAARRVRAVPARPRRSRWSRPTRPRCTGSTSPALRAIGDRIGPTVGEVQVPLDPSDYPADSTCNAFDHEQVDQGLVAASQPAARDRSDRWQRFDTARGRRTQQRNREVEATTAKIWSTAVTVWWETDLDVIRAVLPPPLEPSEPIGAHPVRDRRHGHGHPGVRCRMVRRAGAPRERRGRVRAVHADDHRAGDGRRPRDVRRAEEDRERLDRRRRRRRARAVRAHGLPARGGAAARSATPIDIPPRDKVDFYFKISPSPDGKGFDTEPALVHCRRHEEARDGRAIDGALQLFESPLDPIADIPIGRIDRDAVRAGRDDARRRGRRAGAGRLAPAVRAPALRRPVGARQEGLTPR